MLTLEEIIGNLLLRHNCVVIPGFGGFVAKQISSYIDYSNGMILPPRKSLLFNRQLMNNDGLLVNEYAKANASTFENSTEIIKEKIAQWNDRLRNGERISIDKVGILYFDSEKNICFEQDRFFNLLLASYGLGKVHFISETEVEIVQHELEQQPIKTSEEQTIVAPFTVVKNDAISPIEEKQAVVIPIDTKIAKTRSSKTWKYIAAACLLPIAFYSIWIPMKTDVLESGMISLKDFNPFSTSVPAVYEVKSLETKITDKSSTKSLEEQLTELATETATYQYNFSEDIFLTVKLPSENNVQQSSTETISTSKEPVAVSKGNYNYIVGCFSDESNAINLVSKLKAEGLAATIVDVKGGLHRVSAGSASNEMDFAKIISVSESKGYQGWILK